eukprot:c17891_g1_i1 orf=102-296(+)
MIFPLQPATHSHSKSDQKAARSERTKLDDMAHRSLTPALRKNLHQETNTSNQYPSRIPFTQTND